MSSSVVRRLPLLSVVGLAVALAVATTAATAAASPEHEGQQSQLAAEKRVARNPYSWMANKRARNPYSWMAEKRARNPYSWMEFDAAPRSLRAFAEPVENNEAAILPLVDIIVPEQEVDHAARDGAGMKRDVSLSSFFSDSARSASGRNPYSWLRTAPEKRSRNPYSWLNRQNLERER